MGALRKLKRIQSRKALKQTTKDFMQEYNAKRKDVRKRIIDRFDVKTKGEFLDAVEDLQEEAQNKRKLREKEHRTQ